MHSGFWKNLNITAIFCNFFNYRLLLTSCQLLIIQHTLTELVLKILGLTWFDLCNGTLRVRLESWGVGRSIVFKVGQTPCGAKPSKKQCVNVAEIWFLSAGWTCLIRYVKVIAVAMTNSALTFRRRLHLVIHTSLEKKKNTIKTIQNSKISKWACCVLTCIYAVLTKYMATTGHYEFFPLSHITVVTVKPVHFTSVKDAT